MNPAISNMMLMFGLMQVSKKIPFDDPMIVFYARVAYLVSNIFIFSLYLFARYKINKKNGRTNGYTDLTTLKYVEPAQPFVGSSNERKLVTTTVKEYDLQQVSSAIRSSFMGIGILLFMHFKLGYTNPLVMQSVLPVKSALEQKIIQIHVFGKPATGDLKRPFKSAGLFGAGGTGEVQTDKKAISQAEKSGSGGVKDE
ncbi:inorganic phosphate transporter Pho88 [Lipomyces tetrasporus]|uniref:Inorganic phosphate transporter Pho88 n=1 Tax=Lipomyces tetrasporus TaxID=54092 RepID=A0AAD7QZE3_9ASCO|nr:inorganic phosphate transporter Pho88 [Lipomyces tetrasporus]KAJ8104285.1 inorganic phosphate transporter Pho88 [Lipomyces tetrasporus]